MIVRLISLQIGQFWDVIKYSLQQVERIGIDDSEIRFNELLAALLSDKAQCFLKYKDDRISMIMITEIFEERNLNLRSLKIRSLYSFALTNNDEWEEDFKIIRDFALGEKCTQILLDTGSGRVEEIVRGVGFKKLHTTMGLQLGG